MEFAPLPFIPFDEQEQIIKTTYDVQKRRGEIVFYGASNFCLWEHMEEDLAPYKVQNHGFCGATDEDLIDMAERMLFAYEPAVVAFQTATNDFTKLTGTDEEVLKTVLARKVAMYEAFHARLPGVPFVVTNAIVMPGRESLWGNVRALNRALKKLCDELDYLYFVDAENLTTDECGIPVREKFIEDGIHLTQEVRRQWAGDYIKPVLDRILLEHPEQSGIKR